MSDFINTLKDLFIRGAKFIGSAASRVAKDIKFKINEMRELGKRRDLISELGAVIYKLNQNGFELPEEGRDLVSQITALDNGLAGLRADHAADKAAAAQKRADEKAARAAEKAAAKSAAAAINNSFTYEADFSEPEMPVAEDNIAPDTVPYAPVVPTLDVEDDTAAAEQPADDGIPTLHV